MVAFIDVQAQLVGLQTKAGFLGVHEVRKLAFLLEPNEKILLCKKGWLNKKSTILCVTDKKIAFIDVRASNYLMGTISFDDITAVLRANGRFSQTVRIHTSDAALSFVVWQVRNAKELHAVIDRHWRYIQGKTTSSRAAHTPTMVRDMQSWRSLVKRVGATSVSR